MTEQPARLDAACARRILLDEYGLSPARLTPAEGGTTGAAFCAGGRYFLKLLDTGTAIGAQCAAPLEDRLTVLKRLASSPPLAECVCAPLPTASGRLSFSRGNIAGALFPWVDGEAIGFGNPLTPREQRWLAAFSAALHSLDPAPFRSCCPAEDFSPAFAAALARQLSCGGFSEPFAETAAPYAEEIVRRAAWLDGAAACLRRSPPAFVLCHTDLHGGNLLRGNGGRLFAVDWDSALLAPREADLFLFREEPFFPLFREPADAALLTYYQVRRDLEDLWEFGRALAEGRLSAAEAEAALSHTRRIAAQLCRIPL